LGSGNCDIAKILKEFVPENSVIALETGHENAATADLWIKDIECVKNHV
jgi:hypothetical protein